jgi:hypothetical protein
MRPLAVWFGTVSLFLVAWGIAYAVFGLRILPISNRDTLLAWESALYGAIMMGWGATLFMLGRIAFRRNDKELKQALLGGLVVWLLTEAIFSGYLDVWFNVGVDVAVMALFGLPLIVGFRQKSAPS